MDGMDVVAKVMEISAVTAPKSKGENYIKTRVLEGDVVKKLAGAMVKYGVSTQKKDFGLGT